MSLRKGMTTAVLAWAVGAAMAGCALLDEGGAPAPPPRPVLASESVGKPQPPRAPQEKPRVIVKRQRVSCVPKDLPRAPKYPDSDEALRAAPGAADRYQLMGAGRLLRQQRLELLERVLEGCR